jgi:25S rRNA (adenine2142-N1)-methyltransferase
MGRKQTRSLAKGRPPLSKPNASLSSRATRTIIRKHHNLLKAQSLANRSGDSATLDRIAKEINENGGLEKYQKASQIGQLSSRGGDTSKLLKTWLEELDIVSKGSTVQPLDVLEVGCLKEDNVISTVKGMNLVRIDLHSSHPSILEQDFMLRPLPKNDQDRFDILSLSLVLNYVATANDRGAMLIRTTEFLRKSSLEILPALFFTLPLPCVVNSRYMTSQHLEDIMASLGYTLLKSKETTKIYYSLWSFDENKKSRKQFKKTEIHPGKGRNNFSIVVDI